MSESYKPMQCFIELRKAKRYLLNAPAHFIWAPKGGEPQSGQGVTRDINTFGVYIQTDALPLLDALVQLEIVFPKLADTGCGMHLHGEGVVLRTESRGSQGAGASDGGFAISTQFSLEPPESAFSRLKILSKSARSGL